MEEGSVEVKECAFKDILDTCNDTKKFDTKTLSAKQFTKIEECSGKRCDKFFETLGNKSVHYHNKKPKYLKVVISTRTNFYATLTVNFLGGLNFLS